MPNTIPWVLAEGVLTLYLADALGNPVQEVWMGARVEGLEASGNIEEIESTPSGAAYDEFEQLGESHEIRIDRIWVVRAGDRADFRAQRGRYAMVIYHEDRVTGVWQRRTYYFVTTKQLNLKSNGLMEYAENQSFRARYFIGEDGRLAEGAASTPGYAPESGGSVSSVVEQPLLFTHGGVMIAPDYFAGFYRFASSAVRVTWAKVMARAPQTTATVITLEVNGILSSVTLTIPVGAVNVEVSASGSFSLDVPAGSDLRWKIVSGPSTVEEAGWCAAVSMNVREV